MSSKRSLRGVYLLLLQVKKDLRIRVGSLGKLWFRKGFYVYVGSAQINLEKRIRRHRRRFKKRRWHIDYLTINRAVETVKAVGYELPRKYECILATNLLGMGYEPINGFGSTDCGCKSHLYRIGGDFDKIVKRLSKHLRVEPITFS